MIKTITKFGIAAAFLSTFAFATSASAGSVSVSVKGVKNGKGSVKIYIFNTGPNFDAGQQGALNKALKSASRKAKKGTISASFKGLKDGTYAVSVFHDANGNNKYDFSASSWEGWGYSNNVGKANVPSYSQAKFTVSGNKSLSIDMNY